MGREPSDLHTEVDRFCAGTSPSQNGLEERLDMIAAQLAVIAIELRELMEVMRDDKGD